MEAEAKAKAPGNPAFRLTPEEEKAAMDEFDRLATEVEQSNVPQGTMLNNTSLGVTAEDREIDQMLERAAKTQPHVDDMGPDIVVAPEKKTRDTLRNYVDDYKPATSLMELDEQVMQAQGFEIDSIEASPALVRHVFKRDYDHIKNVTGYGIYHNIRVYIDGVFEQNKDADKLMMEQKLHSGGAKVDTVPIITPKRT